MVSEMDAAMDSRVDHVHPNGTEVFFFDTMIVEWLFATVRFGPSIVLVTPERLRRRCWHHIRPFFEQSS